MKQVSSKMLIKQEQGVIPGLSHNLYSAKNHCSITSQRENSPSHHPKSEIMSISQAHHPHLSILSIAESVPE